MARTHYREIVDWLPAYDSAQPAVADLNPLGDNAHVVLPSWLTCVDEAARCSFTELLRLVGERDLHDPRDVSRWRLDPNGVWRDELEHDRAMRSRIKERLKGNGGQTTPVQSSIPQSPVL